MTIQLVEPTMIFRVPLSVYTVPTGYEARALYVHARKTKAGTWNELMLEAQNSGCRLPTAAEWYIAREFLKQRDPESEKDFIQNVSEWSGTVLDYTRGELLEGITLGPDGEITAVEKRLGREQGIVLPKKSGYVRNLDGIYIPLVHHLWGVEDIEELPEHAYLWVNPTGFTPVVRGRWVHETIDSRRDDVVARYGAEGVSYAARFASETRPEDATIIEFE